MKKTLYLAGFLTITSVLVTLIAYLGYYGTITTIEANRAKKIQDSIALLYNPDDGFIKNDDQADNSYQEKKYKIVSSVYEVLNSEGEIHAVIYDCTFQGRNGPMSALVAVDPYTDIITGVNFYNHGETPNLGEKYTRVDYILGGEETDYIGLVGQSIAGVEVDVIAGASTTSLGIDKMFVEIAVHYKTEEVHING